MASKLIYVVIVIVSVIGVTQNDQVPHLKGDILNRIGVSGWNIRGIEKVEKMFLEEETDPELEMMRRELLGSVLASYQICHDGVEDASRKMNSLLDYYDPDGIDGIKNLKEYEMEDNVEDLGEEKEDEKEEEGFLYDVEEVIALKDDLSDLFKPDESNRHLIRPTYVKDLEKFLHSINHACFSLSSALPHIHQNRKPRSPQKLVKRLAHSLSKWTERWVDTIESKFSTFMTNCLNQKVCKKYIEKLITNLIQISEENKKKIGKEPSGILEELLHDLSHTDTPSMESLSNFQKEVLKMGNSFEGFGKEEEDSFAMAEGISNGAEGKMGSNMDIYLGHRLSLLPALFKFSANGKDIAKQAAEVEIEMTSLAASVPDTFLSFAFGSSLIDENWKQIKHKLPRFLNIASSLSPAMLRVGGSSANFLTYDPTQTQPQHLEPVTIDLQKHKKIHPKLQHPLHDNHIIKNLILTSDNHPKSNAQYQINLPDHPFGTHHSHCDPQFISGKEYQNFTMTRYDWEFLANLTHELKWSLLFDLNQFWRDPQGNWDPTNANVLFDDPITSKVPITWQLGNEPNSYHHKFNWTLSPEQAANDYKMLRHQIEKRNSFGNRQIVGPDVTRPKHVIAGEQPDLTQDSMEFLERFLKAGSGELDAITWHQYYIDGHSATLEDFVSVETFNEFPKQLQKITSLRDKMAPEKRIWLTETASAWGGGAPGLSNRFVASLLWLDKLGAAALGGVSTVIRQTLYGGCYGLLDSHLNPNPDFWVSVVHKELVGNGVLLPRTRLAPDNVRIYAHCLKSQHRMYKKGAIVIVAINLCDEGKHLSLVGENLKQFPKFLYELSPPQGDLRSKDIWLNGKVLRLGKHGRVPDLTPYPDLKEGLNMAPWSMHFWVLPEAGATVC